MSLVPAPRQQEITNATVAEPFGWKKFPTVKLQDSVVDLLAGCRHPSEVAVQVLERMMEDALEERNLEIPDLKNIEELAWYISYFASNVFSAKNAATEIEQYVVAAKTSAKENIRSLFSAALKWSKLLLLSI